MMQRKLFLAALFSAAFFFVVIVIFRADLLPAMPKQNAAVILTGKVYKIEEKEKQVLLFLSHAKGEEGESVSSYGHVILSVSAEQFSATGIKIGNRINAACNYTGFGQARNEGNFDEETYYWSMGISGKFRLPKKGKVEIDLVKAAEFHPTILPYSGWEPTGSILSLIQRLFPRGGFI